MLIGTGCGVPGVMASRTIESDRDRKMTIMTTTFIPCSAKLPIIALIAGALFHEAWWVAPSAYFIGIAAIICSGIILKKPSSATSANPKRIPNVPTTFSFAINPDTAATAIFQSPHPKGAKSGATILPIAAKILLSNCSSSNIPKDPSAHPNFIKNHNTIVVGAH